MATARELVSVLVALEFVFVAAVVLSVFPLEKTYSVIPLFLVFGIGLYSYVT